MDKFSNEQEIVGLYGKEKRFAGFGDFVPGNDYIYQVDDELDMYEARAKMILGTVYILLGM